MSRFLIAVALGIIVVACTKSNETLYNEVMDVHDEVMPKMDDLYKAKKNLQEKLKDSTLHDTTRMRMQTLVRDLDQASESMMVWMREFNPLPDSTSEDKARQYLEGEMVRIQKVKKDMLEALERAKGG